MLEHSSAPNVTVGIDGSQSALDAALWAVDEAIALRVPLQLVDVVEPADQLMIDPQDRSRGMTAAADAVRKAVSAVQATERPVTVQGEVLVGRPVQALLDAAHCATMLCVGARGLKHATQGRIGSTAAALSAAARCPVVIVRAHRPHSNHSRTVVIEVEDSANGGAVLQRGLEVARRRGAPVRVLTPARMHADVQAHWQRRLAEWQRRFADLDITSVNNQGDGLDYIRTHADEIQLVVVGRERRDGLGALVGAPGNAALRDTDCSIMVCDARDAL
ncbi:MAG: universal stress protein [Actinomycetia bacterium]|nr:universal stress protein [Actinomycetes bacterium]